jgi:peroxiredoxin Q/BCP
LLLGLAGVVTYFLLLLRHDPTLTRWLEMPIFNLIAIVVGLGLSAMGVYRARSRTHGGRVLAPIAAVINVAFTGLFVWWLFSYSYQIPAAARAPAVGAVAPDFTLPDHRGNEVRLSSLRGQPVVLLFYRGFW